MEMMVVDLLVCVLVLCFWVGFIVMLLLVVIFSVVGILGGYFVGVGLIGVDFGVFWLQMQVGVDVMDDVLNGVIKSVVFGVVVIFIVLYQGYEVKVMLEGVLCVIIWMVVIVLFIVLVLDFVFMVLMFS